MEIRIPSLLLGFDQGPDLVFDLQPIGHPLEMQMPMSANTAIASDKYPLSPQIAINAHGIKAKSVSGGVNGAEPYMFHIMKIIQ